MVCRVLALAQLINRLREAEGLLCLCPSMPMTGTQVTSHTKAHVAG